MPAHLARFSTGLLLGLAAVTAVPAPLAAEAAAAETIELRLAPPIGEPVRQRMTMEMQMRQTMPGQAEPMDMTTAMTMDTRVVALDEQPEEGDFVLELTIDRATMDIKVPMAEPMHYDSEDADAPADGAAAAAFAPMAAIIGESMRTTLTDRGVVVEADAGGLAAPGQAKEMMESMMAGQPVLPEGPLAVGDRWEQKVETAVPGGMPMELKMGWTLTGFDEKVARFDVDGDNEVNLEPGGGATVRMRIETRGTASIDRTTGLIHAMDTEQTITGETTMQDMTIPMDMTMTTKMETLE